MTSIKVLWLKRKIIQTEEEYPAMSSGRSSRNMRIRRRHLSAFPIIQGFQRHFGLKAVEVDISLRESDPQ